ncbi:hypothetical protein DFQ27_008724 [Actinomortierella ambigua]|uniref:Enoyl reductase (ER) domain-containing protein n=1 Tax=Actinomortierella ambigua TaxID=1343610 RepID=A0A9P6PQR9_9FUNG|nr:hypothetical protein DFQ26_007696 [Actinomortierella ambigua]KAG0251479.1 hypothetical protein DFQ27_008724 [Actinomortierella ambigua]
MSAPNVSVVRHGFATAKPLKTSNFKVIPNEPLPELQDGQVLTRTLYLSMEPFLRFSFDEAPDAKSEGPIVGPGIGEIVKSKHPDYQVGEVVKGMTFPWSAYAVQTDPKGLRKIPARGKIPLSKFISALGLASCTAWSSIKHRGNFKAGEIIYVSSAAGGVGQVVVQLAKRAGLKVIASAGTDAKVDYLSKQLKADYVFNYKKHDQRAELDKALAQLGSPSGFDIYYDTVQGETLDIALEKVKPHGRIIAVGMMSTLGKKADFYTYKNFGLVVRKHLDILGYTLFSHLEDATEFLQTMIPLVESGQISVSENIVEGIENAPKALIDMLDGQYNGKVIVHVADL